MRNALNWTVAAILVLSPAVVRADETIDNPEFASWSKFKVGTSITIKSITEFGGMSTESQQVVKLVEATADKLVLDTAGSTTVAGMKIDIPAMKREIAKTITLTVDLKKAKADAEKLPPDAKTEEGAETLTMGGAQFKCKWRRTQITIMGNATDTKIWTSDDVPGGTLKMESSTGGAMTVKTKFEVSAFMNP
jgi:hypothetical protein